MANLINQLEIERCPHCHADTPTMHVVAHFETNAVFGNNRRFWKRYVCRRCGGVVTASAGSETGGIAAMYPRPTEVDSAIPDPAKPFLTQAIQTLHAPAGSVMLTASAIDAMLKNKGYKDGSLYSRINTAAENHIITEEMKEWAHDVRLDANDPRHADEESPLPETHDAQRCIDFAQALAQFLFVLPARVRRGRDGSA